MRRIQITAILVVGENDLYWNKEGVEALFETVCDPSGGDHVEWIRLEELPCPPDDEDVLEKEDDGQKG